MIIDTDIVEIKIHAGGPNIGAHGARLLLRILIPPSAILNGRRRVYRYLIHISAFKLKAHTFSHYSLFIIRITW